MGKIALEISKPIEKPMLGTGELGLRITNYRIGNSILLRNSFTKKL